MTISTGTITAVEAARLMRAVAKDNVWKRGKKERMECWKNIFGIFVNIRCKDPRYSIEGRGWRADFEITEYFSPLRENNSRHFVEVPVPTFPNKVQVYKGFVMKKTERSTRSVVLRLEALHGEEAYMRDMLLLRMFESEWELIEGRGVDQ